jgi:hypothetical protein
VSTGPTPCSKSCTIPLPLNLHPPGWPPLLCPVPPSPVSVASSLASALPTPYDCMARASRGQSTELAVYSPGEQFECRTKITEAEQGQLHNNAEMPATATTADSWLAGQAVSLCIKDIITHHMARAIGLVAVVIGIIFSIALPTWTWLWQSRSVTGKTPDHVRQTICSAHQSLVRLAPPASARLTTPDPFAALGLDPDDPVFDPVASARGGPLAKAAIRAAAVAAHRSRVAASHAVLPSTHDACVAAAAADPDALARCLGLQSQLGEEDDGVGDTVGTGDERHKFIEAYNIVLGMILNDEARVEFLLHVWPNIKRAEAGAHLYFWHCVYYCFFPPTPATVAGWEFDVMQGYCDETREA